MKNIIKIVILGALIYLLVAYRMEIVDYVDKIVNKHEVTIIEPQDDYALRKSYDYYKITENYEPSNKDELLDLIYTVLDSGYTEYVFYCDRDYTNCITDLNSLMDDYNYLSEVNNFVHPYNSYNTISTFIYGDKITLTIKNIYSDEDITAVNDKARLIIQENINDSMSDREKIKVVHDYIINHTKYDQDGTYSNNNKAVGALIDGYAICSGYSDATSVLLDMLGIPNIKISSLTHVWNLVYVDDTWLHLDLTWDDPISSKKDVLSHDYFLITTDKLLELDSIDHNFNKDIYTEAK